MPKFARDVFANILANLAANLITVALVYLGGVAAGLLPYSLPLLLAAAVILLVALFAVGTYERQLRPSLKKARWFVWFTVIGSGVAPIEVVAFFILASDIWKENQFIVVFWAIEMLVTGAVYIVAVFATYRWYVSLKRAEADRRKPSKIGASRPSRILRRQPLRQSVRK